MKLIEQSESKLVFRSRPSLLISWAILAGAISCWTAIYFIIGSLIVKVLCILGSVLIAFRFLEHWRELTLDKLSGNLIYKDDNIFQKLFHHGSVKVVKLRDIKQSNTDIHNDKVLFYCNQSKHVLANFDQNKGSIESYDALIKAFLNIANQTSSLKVEDEGNDDVMDIYANLSEPIVNKATKKSEEDLMKLDPIKEHLEENDEIEKSFEHLEKEDIDEDREGIEDVSSKNDKTASLITATDFFKSISDNSSVTTTISFPVTATDSSSVTPTDITHTLPLTSHESSQQDSLNDSFIRVNKEDSEGDKEDIKQTSFINKNDIKEILEDIKCEGDNEKNISVENVQNVIEKSIEKLCSDVLKTEKVDKKETLTTPEIDENVKTCDYIGDADSTCVKNNKNKADNVTKTIENTINENTETKNSISTDKADVPNQVEAIETTMKVEVNNNSIGKEKAEEVKEKIESVKEIGDEEFNESLLETNLKNKLIKEDVKEEMVCEEKVKGEMVNERRDEGEMVNKRDEGEMVNKREEGEMVNKRGEEGEVVNKREEGEMVNERREEGEMVNERKEEGEMVKERREKGVMVNEGKGEGTGASSDEDFELVSKEEIEKSI